MINEYRTQAGMQRVRSVSNTSNHLTFVDLEELVLMSNKMILLISIAIFGVPLMDTSPESTASESALDHTQTPVSSRKRLAPPEKPAVPKKLSKFAVQFIF